MAAQVVCRLDLKSPFLIALVPGTILIFAFSLIVYLLFSSAFLTLYDMDGLFNEELNVSWLYPVIVLTSITVYPPCGYLYALLRYGRFGAAPPESLSDKDEEWDTPVAVPIGDSLLLGVAVAWIGTLLSFPIWLYMLARDVTLFVILYDDGLTALGYHGILLAGILRHWGLQLVLSAIIGAVFSMIGTLWVDIPPPPAIEPLLYEPE